MSCRAPPIPESPILASIKLAITLAASAEALALWWQAHQIALRSLSPAELQAAIAAKDRRKATLAAPSPGIPPPSMVLPSVRRLPGHDSRRLI